MPEETLIIWVITGVIAGVIAGVHMMDAGVIAGVLTGVIAGVLAGVIAGVHMMDVVIALVLCNPLTTATVLGPGAVGSVITTTRNSSRIQI
jgi:TctA family transporter